MVTLAQRRATSTTGIAFGPDATVPIGDTPADVAAGRTTGTRVIGVATAETDAPSLLTAGATWAATNVSQRFPILDALLD